MRRGTDAGIVKSKPSLSDVSELTDDTNLRHPRSSITLDMLSPLLSISDESWQHPQGITANNNRIEEGAIRGFGAQPLCDGGAGLRSPSSSNVCHPETLLDRILAGDNVECIKARDPAVWMRVKDGDEYTGPSSGISAISDVGLNWIRDHVPDSDGLCETIEDIRNGLLNHLRQPKCIPSGPLLRPGATFSFKPIPQSQVQKYVEAYFSTVQIIFPVLDREEFESQLAVLGTSSDCMSHSWKALLNAVLASGCRATLSDETASAFQESGRESWGYFQNALSYESMIIHGATDLMAVQAMTVMTLFAQGLSSPQRLEYTLCSIASRLAQSLALNRHPSPEWNLSEDEKRARNRVFWTIYCLDKTIALRCGRPSAIQDDEISCCFLRDVQMTHDRALGQGLEENSRQVFDFFLCFTRLSRICGTVSRYLYSATALQLSSAQLSATLEQLLQDLELWRRAIPAEIQPGKPFGRIKQTKGLSRIQLLVLHSSYYYVLCAISRRFAPLFTQDEEKAQQLVTSKIAATHIEAARSMVLLTKHLDIESFTPGW